MVYFISIKPYLFLICCRRRSLCGIAGYELAAVRTDKAEDVLCALRTIAHRGPDDEGLSFMDRETGECHSFRTNCSVPGIERYPLFEASGPIEHTTCLGHRRFQIVDPTMNGHQPFWTANNEVCVTFHGEIYNFVELRSELEKIGVVFKTSSDTEVLAYSYLEWGESCFERFNGFWALCLHDTRRRRTLIARDRIGEAPLYFVKLDRGIFWSSEINGIFSLLGREAFTVNPRSVSDFLRHRQRDFRSETFYREINTFPSGSYSWIQPDGSMNIIRFWSPPLDRLKPSDIPVHEAASTIRDILSDSVRIRLRSDVNVAVQVSGGLDSSALLALSAVQGRQVDAYTVTFPEPYNESHYAVKVAEHYPDQVNLHIIDPPEDEFFQQGDSFINHMAEPFHSPNQVTTHAIWSEISRHGFRATLHGSGGDEVFAGYTREYFIPYLRDLLMRGDLSKFSSNFLRFSERSPGPLGIDFALRAGIVMGGVGVYESIFERVGARDNPAASELSSPDFYNVLSGSSEERMVKTLSDWKMNYQLRSDNQNSMLVPLEMRLPFLDHRLIDFVFTLPFEYLIRDGWKKWIFRVAMEDLLPPEIIWRRRKMGFPFPIKSWLALHRERILGLLADLQCPYIDIVKLSSSYEALRRRNSNYLWCLISTALWWKNHQLAT
jgi:asparagine synthase (glutamine-hydrolysing)